MKKLSLVLAAAFGVLLVSGDTNADKKAPSDKAPAVKKVSIKCPVSGRDAAKGPEVAYKGTKVKVCCPGCPGAFAKSTAKYAVKANMQLAQLDRAKQVKCPFSGGPMNKKAFISIGGEKVNFCCNNCLARAKKAKDAAQLVFNDKAFAKGFKVVKAKKDKSEK